MHWSFYIAALQLVAISSTISIVQSKTQNGEGSSHEGSRRAPKFGERIRPFVREAKSLRNTFPFAANTNEAHQSRPDSDHHHHEEVNNPRNSRQGQGEDVALDIGTIAAAGERCIDKVITVQETEYDDVIECKHSYTERCHTTYKTDYTPQQEEECDENFKKNCFIEYKNVAFKEKVTTCHQPLVRNCNIPGPIECSTEYQTQCTTRYHEHQVEDDVPNCVEEQEFKCNQVTQGYTTEEQCKAWPVKKCSLQRERVNKYTPETHCKKVPYELCGPSTCPVEAGPEQCQDREETIVQEAPEEVCTLEPQRECKHVTKLVPRLEPAENCLDVPKEVCVRSRANPRRVSRPIVKKWCYTPSAESGLLGQGQTKNRDNNQGRRPQPSRTPSPPEGCLRGKPFDYCPTRAGNRRCDQECNTQACGYDGGDCTPVPTQAPQQQGCLRGRAYDYCPTRAGNRRCDQECNTQACGYDGGDCTPAPTQAPPQQQGCLRGRQVDYCPRRRSNGNCDQECNTSACGFDGGDCNVQTPPPRQNCLRGKPANYCEQRSNNGRCDSECNTAACGYDNGECNQQPLRPPPPPPQRPQPPPRRPQPPPPQRNRPKRPSRPARPTPGRRQPGCLRGNQANYCEVRKNNGQCEAECNIAACQFDGGDCRKPSPHPPTNGYLPPPPPGGYGKK